MFAVLPFVILVLILNFTFAPLETNVLLKFLFGAFLIIFGLTIFLLGVNISIDPIGSLMGRTLTKTNKLWIIVITSLIIGFVVSITEPDLHIIAEQVNLLTSGVISKNA